MRTHGPFALAGILSFLALAFLLLGANVAWCGETEQAPCPVTTISKSCFDCHVRGKAWPAVKETDPHRVYDYPNGSTKILVDEAGERYGHYLLKHIDSDDVQDFFEYVDRHNIKKVVIEAFSPGGSMVHAIKIVDLMRCFQAQGGIVETRCHGLAASAGFMVFVGGTKGHRYVAPYSLLMWHELISFKLFDISSPSDKEDEARVLRFFQNKGNEYLAGRSNLSKEKLDELIHKKEFWMSGTEAIEYGFADGLLGM